jgi:Tripartite tricarboxylate transporter TctB family
MTAGIHWRNLGAALFILAISVVFVFWSRTYSGQTRTVPELVAWIAVVLALIDVVIQFDTASSRWLRALVSAKRIVEWKVDGDDATLPSVLLSIGWVVGFVVILYFVGFLIATPTYVLLYMIFHGGHSVRNSALAAAGTTLMIWLTFVVLFKYPLYEGVLFGAY